MRGLGDALVEVYVPVRTPGGTDLLFEAYFRYNGVAEAGRRVWERFASAMFGALVVVTVLQIPSAVSLARRSAPDPAPAGGPAALGHRAPPTPSGAGIATDLHDGVVQDLAGVGFSLAAPAREAEAGRRRRRPLRRAGEQVREEVRALRSLLVEIYPPSLTESGLEAALERPDGAGGSQGIATTLRRRRGPAGRARQAMTTRLLYRTRAGGTAQTSSPTPRRAHVRRAGRRAGQRRRRPGRAGGGRRRSWIEGADGSRAATVTSG